VRGTRATFGLALLMLAVSTATRLPGLVSGRMYNVDEGYLAAMGWVMERGGHLYLDVVDRKPPVLPWIYSLSVTVFGNVDLRFVRALSVVSVAGTALVVALIVRQLRDGRGAVIAAGLLVSLGSAAFPPADGLAANFELFALLPASAAVLLAVVARGHSRLRRSALLVAAGALVGAAAMTKQPLMVVALPVAWEAGRGPRRLPGLLAALTGLVGATVVIGLPFGLGHVWRWAWLDTYDFLNGQVGGWRILPVLLITSTAFAVLHAPMLFPIWRARRGLAGVDRVAWLWLLAAAAGLMPGFRFLIHYFHLVVPPLALVVGLMWDDLAVRVRQRLLPASAVVAVLCSLAALLPWSNASQVSAALVAAVDANTAPGDRLMVWGALPELYWRTQRLPGVRFLSVGYVNGNWADQPTPPVEPETRAPYQARWRIFNGDLLRHAPTVVVDMSGSTVGGWSDYPADNYSFGRVLHACYTPFAAIDHNVLWRLDSPGCLVDQLP
jgi:4-amino-4-deoxy-L-arabinose transferase-like glycosyltransferase